MGFVINQSFFSAQSSPCSLQHPWLFSSPRNAVYGRKKRAATACLQQEAPKDDGFCKRRAILYMGFAAIPLLDLKNEALAQEATESSTLDQKPEAKHSTSPFLSLLNILGYLGSGVLAALYGTLQKEKTAADATIESINIKLKEKDVATASLKKKYESELLNEKDVRNKAITKANEEKQSLVDQLQVANGTIRSLGEDLRKEKKSVEVKTTEVEKLEAGLRKTRDETRELKDELKEKLRSLEVLQERIKLLSSEIKDKEDNLKHVKSKLAEKERSLEQLESVHQKSRDQLCNSEMEIQQLKEVIVEKENELELKNVALDNLRSDLTSSRAEVDKSREKIESIEKEYDQLKMASEKKAAFDSELLREKEENLRQLEEQLKVASDDLNDNKVLISDLIDEKGSLTERLDIMLKNVENLEREVETGWEELEKSRDEGAVLAKELKESRILCSDLGAELSRVREEHRRTKESLESEVYEAKRGSEILAGEATAAKEHVSQINEELLTVSEELALAVAKCGSLEKELDEVNKKGENAARDLEDEKNIVFTLRKELEGLDARVLEEKESRRGVEVDLAACKELLDETSQKALDLTRDLDLARSKISSLEDERDALLRSVDEQKKVAVEAHENLEDASNLVARLAKERESLENRGKKLQEELASVKGEILRLKSEMNSSKTRVNDAKKTSGSRVNSSKIQVKDQEVELGKESVVSELDSEETPVSDEEKVAVGSKSGVSKKKATRRKKS